MENLESKKKKKRKKDQKKALKMNLIDEKALIEAVKL